jgi:hypothetical protein
MILKDPSGTETNTPLILVSSEYVIPVAGAEVETKVA